VVRKNLLLFSAIPFELVLASQLVMTKVCLLILRESSVFTSKMKICSMREGMKLWALLVSPSQLNTKFFACASDEFDDFSRP